MARMKRAHGRHKADPLAGLARTGNLRAQIRDAPCDAERHVS
jgi:hypothetical protein